MTFKGYAAFLAVVVLLAGCVPLSAATLPDPAKPSNGLPATATMPSEAQVAAAASPQPIATKTKGKKPMEQARESLKEGETLKSHGLFRGTINRAYYAMFYAVMALAVQ